MLSECLVTIRSSSYPEITPVNFNSGSKVNYRPLETMQVGTAAKKLMLIKRGKIEISVSLLRPTV